jgi:iron complex outermembrane recepter protein
MTIARGASNFEAPGELTKFTLAVSTALGLLLSSANAAADDTKAVEKVIELAQATDDSAAAQNPVGEELAPLQTAATKLDSVQVTGSRILREDYVANSPVTTVTRDDIERNADVTLDTFLNVLPQVNPAGTLTSNNPGNAGQANIDLRGLGANRNLVLIDGRRPMVSGTDQTVDLNTIPSAMIERIEVLTGGAGAVYGADAVAGAVNIILRKNFEGLDFRSSYSDSDEEDAIERSFSAVLGKNFEAMGRGGNFTLAVEYADREPLIKSQRDFAAVATSTTTFLPEGLYFPSANNAPTQAAIDAVFGQYTGYTPGSVSPTLARISFNTDGSLFSIGAFNSPNDNVFNFRYPVDLAVNTNLFPDLYSYNFDSVNVLVLPFERYSGVGTLRFELGGGIDLFARSNWTQYDSLQALAPAPIPTVTIRNAADPARTNRQAASSLVELGQSVANTLVIPATNPFIPADFRQILDSRTGDDARLIGAGATEPFLMRQRTLDLGLRAQEFRNTVYQNLVGLSGPVTLGDRIWNFELSVSRGSTEIISRQTGNVNTDNLQRLLEASDGGASLCAGGFNPFGRNPISPECQAFLADGALVVTTTKFTQQIQQGYLTGSIADLPAGPLGMVIGAEHRSFDFDFDPGAAGSPISGFNVSDPAAGKNSFRDIFTELSFPLLSDVAFAEALDFNVGYRRSTSKFSDTLAGSDTGASNDAAYKFELSWQPLDVARFRTAYQRAVRAPNFGELFSGGGSAPQIFDPCAFNSDARMGSQASDLRQLCIDTGVPAAAADNFVPSPGGQAQIGFSGNTQLDPEEAKTFTIGAVFEAPSDSALAGLTASIDYYNIDIFNPITGPDVNVVIADCYNYFGTNSTFDSDTVSCQNLLRIGGNILLVGFNGDPFADNPTINQGKARVSGVDLQLNYGMNLPVGRLNVDALINHRLKDERQDGIDQPLIDFAGTVSYFGAGLGASSPDWKALINTRWLVSDFGVNLRTRYLHGMDNRLSKIFPGESAISGVGSVTYWDLSGSWSATSNIQLIAGVNNLLDKQPPVYAPNVQSGTDPSLYDVVGRRFFVQGKLSF